MKRNEARHAMFLSVLLTPSAGGSIALRWAKETGGSRRPTLDKRNWMQVTAGVIS